MLVPDMAAEVAAVGELGATLVAGVRALPGVSPDMAHHVTGLHVFESLVSNLIFQTRQCSVRYKTLFLSPKF